MKITKTQLKNLVREAVKEHMDEAVLSSGGAMRRKLLDKVRTRRETEILVNGDWYTVDDGSIDPEEPDTLFVLDKNGGEHEVKFADIESVE